MGRDQTMDASWVPGAGVGLVGSVAAYLLSWRVHSARAEERAQNVAQGISKAFDELKRELNEGFAEMRAIGTTTAKLQSSQDVVNAVTAKAVEAIVKKQEDHSSTIAEHTAALRLLSELMDRRSKLEGREGSL